MAAAKNLHWNAKKKAESKKKSRQVPLDEVAFVVGKLDLQFRIHNLSKVVSLMLLKNIFL